MFYGMAAEGQMPKWAISRLHPKFNICRRSMTINWILTALVLWYADSWASLMVVVTGYHIIGYMAAPISMGAIKPKTRIFGMLIFIVLGLIMTTVPKHDLIMMNLSLLLLMVIFSIIQIRNKVKLPILISLILPLMGYLWLIFVYQNPIYVGAVSAIFYWIITHEKYVHFCKTHKGETLHIEEDAST